MSISENTAKINQLITKVNDLPSAAPTVRRVESSFTVNPVYEEIGGQEIDCVYVDCGFKPDAFYFLGSQPDESEGYPSYYYLGTAMFESVPAGELIAIGCSVMDAEGKMWGLEPLITATETGFKLLYIQNGYDIEAEQWGDATGKTFNYVAIKYT